MTPKRRSRRVGTPSSWRISVFADGAGLAERGQGLQNLLDPASVGALEAPGDLMDGYRRASMDEVVKITRSAVKRCQCFAMLDTLEYLHKGGRIGMAQAFLGSVLKVKPMIILTGGEVHPLDRPRTRARAVARLAGCTDGSSTTSCRRPATTRPDSSSRSAP